MPGFPPNPLMPLSSYQTMAANPCETTPLADTSSPSSRRRQERCGVRAGRWQVQRVAVSRVWHFTGKCRLERASGKGSFSHWQCGVTQAGAAVASGVHTGAPWSAAINGGLWAGWVPSTRGSDKCRTLLSRHPPSNRGHRAGWAGHRALLPSAAEHLTRISKQVQSKSCCMKPRPHS